MTYFYIVMRVTMSEVGHIIAASQICKCANLSVFALLFCIWHWHILFCFFSPDFNSPHPLPLWPVLPSDGCMDSNEDESMTSSLINYLITHSQILAVLRAPTDSAVQTFVHVAVPLVWLVSTIIFPITQVPFRDASPIGAHEEGAIAQASWKEQKMIVTAKITDWFPNAVWECFWPDLEQIDSSWEMSFLVSVLYVNTPVFLASGAAGDTDEEIPAESQTAVLPAARHFKFRGSSSEWSGQSA